MDFVFKAFFLQFLLFGLLVGNVRPQTGGTDCHGKDYLCLDDVRFQLCVDYGDGQPTTVSDEVQHCPQGTFCSNSGHFECDSFVPPSTTAEPQVNVDENGTEQPVNDEHPATEQVVVEDAPLPPVAEETEVPANNPETNDDNEAPVNTEANGGPTTESVEAESTTMAADSTDPEATTAAVEVGTNEAPEEETALPSEAPEQSETNDATDPTPAAEQSAPVFPEEEETESNTGADTPAVETTSQPNVAENEETPVDTTAAVEAEVTNSVTEESSPTDEVATDAQGDLAGDVTEAESTQPEAEVTTEQSPEADSETTVTSTVVAETNPPAEVTEEVAVETSSSAVTEPTETEQSTDAPSEPEPVETEAPEVPEPVETEAPSNPEPVETEAPSNPEPVETEAPEVPEVPETAAPEVPEVLETAAPESETTVSESVTEPSTSNPSTSAPESSSDEPNTGESSSNEGSSSSQDSTERPSAESGAESNEVSTVAPQAPGSSSFLCPTAGRFEHPTDCHKYYVCFWLPFGLYSLEQNCVGGFAYNPTMERCTADQSVCFPGQFTCSGPGRFPDPADPTQYFWCVWNMFGGYLQYSMQCPMGQVYNAFRGRCAFTVPGTRSLPFADADATEEPEKESPGVEDTVDPVTPQVVEQPKLKVKFECLEEGTFADPNNCGRYFVCTLKKLNKFKKSKFKCAAGERFDPLEALCVPDMDALCE